MSVVPVLILFSSARRIQALQQKTSCHGRTRGHSRNSLRPFIASQSPWRVLLRQTQCQAAVGPVHPSPNSSQHRAEAGAQPWAFPGECLGFLALESQIFTLHQAHSLDFSPISGLGWAPPAASLWATVLHGPCNVPHCILSGETPK